MTTETRRPSDRLPSDEDVVRLFSGYSTIAIIANSTALDLAAVQRRLPQNTLFVFFTHCEKVLTEPFARDSMIVHRMRDPLIAMNSDEAMARARSLFQPSGLRGEVGLFVSLETATAAEAKEGRSLVAFPVIDADAYFRSFYTSGHRPSSGFALALWLTERLPGQPVVLCGFTGVRDGSPKMSSMHDWTLEQTLLRVFYRDGRLLRFEAIGAESGSVTRIAKAFPAFGREEIAMVALQVISERVDALDRLTATLQSVWRPLLQVSRKLRRRPAGNKF